MDSTGHGTGQRYDWRMSDGGMWAAIIGLVVVGAIGVALLLKARAPVRRHEVDRLERQITAAVAGAPNHVTMRVRKDLRPDAMAAFEKVGYTLDAVDDSPLLVDGVVSLTFARR